MKLAIETQFISKNYGKVLAVDRLSLQVGEGEIYAFLGLNGAGKTTMIRMLLGMIRPSQGSAVVLGTRVRLGSQEPWASVGYLVETPRAYPELTVRENLEAARRLHPGALPKVVGEMIEKLGLAEYADRRAGTLSLGNVQRLGLAKALLHKPRLLILDEPANGLDPAGIVEIREMLLEQAHSRGVTVFLASHILAEVARLADRVGIIHQGRLLQEQNLNDLEANRQRRLLIQVKEPEKAGQLLIDAGYQVRKGQGGFLEVVDRTAWDQPEKVISLLVYGGNPPAQVILQEEELEEYFLRLVGLGEEVGNESSY